MKKIAICAALCALLLCACGKKQAKELATPTLTVGDTTIEDTTALDTVLDALGADYTYAEAISCVYDGMDKTYTYADAVVFTYPDGEQDRLMELYCTGGEVKTAAGITFGASKDEIAKAYGDGYVESGTVVRYEQSTTSPDNEPASLYFELTDGKVTAIGITAEHRAE